MKFFILPHLCTDVIMCLPFLELHKTCIINFGGHLENFKVLSSSSFSIETPRLFNNLSVDTVPIATKSRKLNIPTKCIFKPIREIEIKWKCNGNDDLSLILNWCVVHRCLIPKILPALCKQNIDSMTTCNGDRDLNNIDSIDDTVSADTIKTAECVLAQLIDRACIISDNEHYFYGNSEENGNIANPFQQTCFQLGLELASMYTTNLTNLDKSKFRNSLEFERIYTCPICQRFKSESRSVLCQHLRIPHAIRARKLVCNLCGAEFATRTEVQCHYVEQHKITPILPPPYKGYSCQFCSYEVTNRHSFLKHIEKCKLMNSVYVQDDKAQAPTTTDMFNYYDDIAYPSLDCLINSQVNQTYTSRTASKLLNRQAANESNNKQNNGQLFNPTCQFEQKSNLTASQFNSMYHGFTDSLTNTALRLLGSTNYQHGSSPNTCRSSNLYPSSFNNNGNNQYHGYNVHNDILSNATFQLLEPFLSRMNLALPTPRMNHSQHPQLSNLPINSFHRMQSNHSYQSSVISRAHFSTENSKIQNDTINHHLNCNTSNTKQVLLNSNDKSTLFNEILTIEQMKETFKDRNVHREIDMILNALKEINRNLNWHKDVKVTEVRSVAGRCTFCPGISFIPDIVQHHRNAHNMQIKYFQSNKICIICSVIMPDSITLVHHQQIVHNMIPMSSLERILQFQVVETQSIRHPSSSNIVSRQHQQNERLHATDKPLVINASMPTTTAIVKTPVKGVTTQPARQYFCKKCLLTDLDLDMLCKHLADQHDVEIRILRTCKICGLNIKEGSQLEHHQLSHIGECSIQLERGGKDLLMIQHPESSPYNPAPSKRRATCFISAKLENNCIDNGTSAFGNGSRRLQAKSTTKNQTSNQQQFDEIVLD
ncbi:hypothetical protein GJ496_009558 [Pomphorhynchus laevis]|nr:hypothetical protein GJ496_009558 [Pomphorhynchus laevis]